MIFLVVRTDKPQAEIGLFNNTEQIAYETWYAHRELSVTLHQKITDLLKQQSLSMDAIDGVIGFAGPGSFTGLRIGLTVANALAYGQHKPVVATKGDDWIQNGIARLLQGEGDELALPEYGAPVHITTQKK